MYSRILTLFFLTISLFSFSQSDNLSLGLEAMRNGKYENAVNYLQLSYNETPNEDTKSKLTLATNLFNAFKLFDNAIAIHDCDDAEKQLKNIMKIEVSNPFFDKNIEQIKQCKEYNKNKAKQEKRENISNSIGESADRTGELISDRFSGFWSCFWGNSQRAESFGGYRLYFGTSAAFYPKLSEYESLQYSDYQSDFMPGPNLGICVNTSKAIPLTFGADININGNEGFLLGYMKYSIFPFNSNIFAVNIGGGASLINGNYYFRPGCTLMARSGKVGMEYYYQKNYSNIYNMYVSTHNISLICGRKTSANITYYTGVIALLLLAASLK